MPLEPSVCQTIAEWARRTAEVNRVWVFGSRAKGTAHSESDLDLAVELDLACLGGESAVTYWQFEHDRMHAELQSNVSFPVDFQQYEETASPHVTSYVLDHGQLLYQKPA